MRVGSKQKKNIRRVYKNSHFIKLFHQFIPVQKYNALALAQKYCLLTLGHVHDEISWLQRMSYITSKSGDKPIEVEAQANLMQATFLARLLLGKLYELYVLMRDSKEIREFIANNFDPSDTSKGLAKVQEIIKLFDDNNWIGLTRNKHGLHYPKMNDVESTLNDPNIIWDINVYHGKNSSNTFYPTSDVLANYAWFKLVNKDEPMKGFRQALDIIRNISLLTLNTLEQSIGFFIDKNLAPLTEHKKIRLKVSDSIYSTEFNYFIYTGK